MKLKLAICSLMLLPTAVSLAAAEEKVGGAAWKARMQSMLSDVVSLLPYAFDEAKYEEPENQLTIKKHLDSLASQSSGLKVHTAKSKSSAAKTDPSIRFVAQRFENEIAAAQSAFNGNKEAHAQSRAYLRSAISKCTLCHTQSSTGPNFKFEQFQSQFSKLNPSDKFLALAATRQFDSALNVFSEILRDAKIKKTDPLAIDRQAKTALAIAVRVKRDPKLTLKLISEIEASKATTPVTQANLADWKSAAVTWQSEPPTKTMKDRALFDEANRLIRFGDRRENSSGRFENANVPMLRASTLLHDLLIDFPKSALRPEAYLLLAKTYDMLPGFSAWDISDEYLAACIEEYPHSEISEKCFKKYQESTILGYSGSSGTNVPSAVVHHLERMKDLAKRTTGVPAKK